MACGNRQFTVKKKESRLRTEGRGTKAQRKKKKKSSREGAGNAEEEKKEE